MRSDPRIAGPVQRILDVQCDDGSIPWFEDGPWDAWNHVECVMALNTVGEADAAWRGFTALLDRQLSCGGFYGEYGNALPMTADMMRIQRVASKPVLDTNFTAYVATGALHHLRCNGRSIRDLWPMVSDAIDHVLQVQHDAGDISWCVEAHGSTMDDALIAGNASIYASIGHALTLATHLGHDMPHWERARAALGNALLFKPERFGRSSQTRPDHAMDSYYPILAGLYAPAAARARLRETWGPFVHPELGVYCVGGQPWTTVAETCELIIAAHHAGLRDEAAALIATLPRYRAADGAFWMGWQNQIGIHWPAEQPSWTQAAYILALDAVEGWTPASDLFAFTPALAPA